MMSKSREVILFGLVLFSLAAVTAHAWHPYFDCPDPVLPAATRTVNVSNDTELDAAIADMQAGDHIVLADGTYDGINIENKNAGTEESPVVFVAENDRQAVVSGSHAGRNMRISNSSYLHVYGVRFTGADVWGVTVGPSYAGDDATLGNHHIRIQNCEIDNAHQELLTTSGNSHHIEFLCNELHHSGRNLNGGAFAEGIYVGCGGTGDDRSHDVLIRGNHIHHIGRADNPGYGEAIDVKVQTYNITIADNLIEHVTVHSQAAITVHVNDVDYPAGQENPNVLVMRNIVHDVRKCDDGWDGCGIWASANGVTISNNIVWDTYRSSITGIQDASNTVDSLRIYNNTCFDVVDGNRDCIALNTGDIYGDANPVRAVLLNNITDDGSGGNDFTATAADFVGPITGDADAGEGAGSGFMLDSGSDAVDGGVAIATVSADITGTDRPQGEAHDMGAFEYAPPVLNSPARNPRAHSVIVRATSGTSVYALNGRLAGTTRGTFNSRMPSSSGMYVIVPGKPEKVLVK
ncbi:MAG: hypothetical protein GF418_04980 [Chitinivibrionales bacterium]|nr:hypothetical protein [Chitinivibrionales bacterium]MBD3394963.1 hypothetical protein [Chitinivibrionales bacterium]